MYPTSIPRPLSRAPSSVALSHATINTTTNHSTNSGLTLDRSQQSNLKVKILGEPNTGKTTILSILTHNSVDDGSGSSASLVNVSTQHTPCYIFGYNIHGDYLYYSRQLTYPEFVEQLLMNKHSSGNIISSHNNHQNNVIVSDQQLNNSANTTNDNDTEDLTPLPDPSQNTQHSPFITHSPHLIHQHSHAPSPLVHPPSNSHQHFTISQQFPPPPSIASSSQSGFAPSTTATNATGTKNRYYIKLYDQYRSDELLHLQQQCKKIISIRELTEKNLPNTVTSIVSSFPDVIFITVSAVPSSTSSAYLTPMTVEYISICIGLKLRIALLITNIDKASIAQLRGVKREIFQLFNTTSKQNPQQKNSLSALFHKIPVLIKDKAQIHNLLAQTTPISPSASLDDILNIYQPHEGGEDSLIPKPLFPTPIGPAEVATYIPIFYLSNTTMQHYDLLHEYLRYVPPYQWGAGSNLNSSSVTANANPQNTPRSLTNHHQTPAPSPMVMAIQHPLQTSPPFSPVHHALLPKSLPYGSSSSRAPQRRSIDIASRQTYERYASSANLKPHFYHEDNNDININVDGSCSGNSEALLHTPFSVTSSSSSQSIMSESATTVSYNESANNNNNLNLELNANVNHDEPTNNSHHHNSRRSSRSKPENDTVAISIQTDNYCYKRRHSHSASPTSNSKTKIQQSNIDENKKNKNHKNTMSQYHFSKMKYYLKLEQAQKQQNNIDQAIASPDIPNTSSSPLIKTTNSSPNVDKLLLSNSASRSHNQDQPHGSDHVPEIIIQNEDHSLYSQPLYLPPTATQQHHITDNSSSSAGTAASLKITSSPSSSTPPRSNPQNVKSFTLSTYQQELTPNGGIEHNVHNHTINKPLVLNTTNLTPHPSHFNHISTADSSFEHSFGEQKESSGPYHSGLESDGGFVSTHSHGNNHHTADPSQNYISPPITARQPILSTVSSLNILKSFNALTPSNDTRVPKTPESRPNMVMNSLTPTNSLLYNHSNPILDANTSPIISMLSNNDYKTQKNTNNNSNVDDLTIPNHQQSHNFAKNPTHVSSRNPNHINHNLITNKMMNNQTLNMSQNEIYDDNDIILPPLEDTLLPIPLPGHPDHQHSALGINNSAQLPSNPVAPAQSLHSQQTCITAELRIDDRFDKYDTGLITSGTITFGSISVNQILFLGPFFNTIEVTPPQLATSSTINANTSDSNSNTSNTPTISSSKASYYKSQEDYNAQLLNYQYLVSELKLKQINVEFIPVVVKSLQVYHSNIDIAQSGDTLGAVIIYEPIIHFFVQKMMGYRSNFYEQKILKRRFDYQEYLENIEEMESVLNNARNEIDSETDSFDSESTELFSQSSSTGLQDFESAEEKYDRLNKRACYYYSSLFKDIVAKGQVLLGLTSFPFKAEYFNQSHAKNPHFYCADTISIVNLFTKQQLIKLNRLSALKILSSCVEQAISIVEEERTQFLLKQQQTSPSPRYKSREQSNSSNDSLHRESNSNITSSSPKIMGVSQDGPTISRRRRKSQLTENMTPSAYKITNVEQFYSNEYITLQVMDQVRNFIGIIINPTSASPNSATSLTSSPWFKEETTNAQNNEHQPQQLAFKHPLFTPYPYTKIPPFIPYNLLLATHCDLQLDILHPQTLVKQGYQVVLHVSSLAIPITVNSVLAIIDNNTSYSTTPEVLSINNRRNKLEGPSKGSNSNTPVLQSTPPPAPLTLRMGQRGIVRASFVSTACVYIHQSDPVLLRQGFTCAIGYVLRTYFGEQND